MAITTENLERLPRWAQSRIRNLEEEVENLRGERDLALRVGEGTTDTLLLDHLHGHIPLAPGSLIRFMLPWQGWEQEAWIDASIDGREGGRPFVEIRAGRAVRIEPMSANSIRLYALTPRDDEETR